MGRSDDRGLSLVLTLPSQGTGQVQAVGTPDETTGGSSFQRSLLNEPFLPIVEVTGIRPYSIFLAANTNPCIHAAALQKNPNF